MSQLEDLTTKCIRCGFCLEACPTFRLTGEETESPRGRIYLVRSAEAGQLDWEATRPHLDRCLGCRACEPACPSGVQYGEILELARQRLETTKPNRWRRILLGTLSDSKRLRRQLALSRLLPGCRIPGFVSRLISGRPPEAERPVVDLDDYATLDESNLPPIRGEVLLLEGCAMRVLFPKVHAATRRLLRRVGFSVREAEQGCCGALHAHNGQLDLARRMVVELKAQLPSDLPLIVNSAGCGSWLKDGRLGDRVQDISEFLLSNGLLEALEASPGLDIAATYHDACHLAHGQRVTQPPRLLIQAIPRLRFFELNEADTCCGSAGIYNLTQPGLARRLLDRKWSNVETARIDAIAMGNPGCQAWLAQASREHASEVRVVHTVELLEASFLGRLI